MGFLRDPTAGKADDPGVEPRSRQGIFWRMPQLRGTTTVHIRTVGTALCGLVSEFLNVSGVFRGGSQSVRFLKSAKEPALL